MDISIALVGNPNVGKTTLYNLLTKSSENVGNFHGVTVDLATKTIDHNGTRVSICDLPGMYSLTTISKEESVSRDRILSKSDILINVCDANNLSRNLYLTLQLLEAGQNVILAVNMVDELRPQNSIDFDLIKSELGIEVVPISAKHGLYINKLLDSITKAVRVKSKLEWLRGLPIDEVRLALRQAGHLDDNYTAIKLLENDEFVCDKIGKVSKIEGIKKGDDYQSRLCKRRFDYISNLMKKAQPESGGERHSWIDKIVLNRYLAIPIFLLILALIFWITFDLLGKPISDVMNLLIVDLFAWAKGILAKAPKWFSALITEAVIGGLGTVICFLPQIILLFFFLALLEETGYLARTAFVLDGLLKKIGLNGRAVFTMLMGFGCTATAVLTARTQSDINTQKKTVMLTPFMSCGAKMTVYSAVCGAYFVDSGALVIFLLYLLGVAVAVLWSAILQKTSLRARENDFIMEVPHYRMPTLSRLVEIIYFNAKLFLVRVGTIILAMTVLMWFVSSFDFSFRMCEDNSIIQTISGYIAPLFKPLGFDSWQAVGALISGLIAKEAVISSIESFGQNALLEMFANSANPSASSISFLVFVLLYIPCVASISAMNKEIGFKLTIISICIQLVTAYAFSLIVFFLVSIFFVLGARLLYIALAVLIIYGCILMIKKYKRQGCDSCKKNNCPCKK